MTSVTEKKSDPLTRLVAWSAVILGGALPFILWGSPEHWALLLPLTQAAGLALAGFAVLLSARLRGLSRYLFALAALRLGWCVITPWLSKTPALKDWSDKADWGAAFLVARSLPLAGAILISMTLIGTGLTRANLFLRPGNLSAPTGPLPIPGFRKPMPWTRFGPLLLVIFAIVLPLFYCFTARPNFAMAGRIIHFLPWIVFIAALNAANEEFQFRCVMLAHLRNVLVPAEAILLSAVLFGLLHYYGQPSGLSGSIMAGFAGWIWARSMIETRGAAWAFFIHMVQDIVIGCFLAMGVVNK